VLTAVALSATHYGGDARTVSELLQRSPTKRFLWLLFGWGATLAGLVMSVGNAILGDWAAFWFGAAFSLVGFVMATKAQRARKAAQHPG
jgi:hypothetical protein